MTPHVQTFFDKATSTATHLVSDPATGVAAIIDPADAVPVLATLNQHGLKATHILNTHWHPDHVGGNLGIREATGCTIFGPAREAHPIPGMDRALE